MMDFGALQCTPKSPNCQVCPFAEQCIAYRTHQTDILPIKSKKTAGRKRYFWYLDIWHQGHTYLQQRTQKDIWQGLYEPYLLEEPLSETEILQHPILRSLNGQVTHISGTFKHVLSHQIIQARFVQIVIDQENEFLKSLQKISDTELNNYPVSRLIERYGATQAPAL
jgi:A/G-specific adenine glycosylase